MDTMPHVHILRSAISRRWSWALACLVIGSLAAAQTTFPEIEPNSGKSEATLVNGIVSGDVITGVSTGTTTTLGLSTPPTVDMFRVRTGPLPYGIYRHQLTITTAGPAGHTGTIRGLGQTGTTGTASTGGTINTTDTAVQFSSLTSTTPRSNVWYGFGRQEEIYYRVEGVGTTTASYAATLSTTPIAPFVVPGSFLPGQITITTVGQGHTTDTDMWLYNSNFLAVPTAGNDDEGPNGPSNQSRIMRSLAAGTYFLALSRFDLANNQPGAPYDEDWLSGNCLDFPHALVDNNSSPTVTAVNVSFSDGTTTTPVPISTSSSYEVVWLTFNVVPAVTIAAGSDLFQTPTGGSSVDFSATPIPAGFFSPGSDPFNGIITLSGSPLGPPLGGTNLPVPAVVDTIVKRLAPVVMPGCPAGGGVPIEIVALSLVSTTPITVTFNGGLSNSQYNVGAFLSSINPQVQGNMNIQRTTVDGGTFDSFLPVQPRLTFTKVSGIDGVSNAVQDPAPSAFLQATQVPWSFDDGGLGLPTSSGGLVNHDGNAATPMVMYPPTSNFQPGLTRVGGDCVNPSGSPRRATIVHMSPTHTHAVTPPPPPPPPCPAFCLGDGSTLACPCGNFSLQGDRKGCLNSTLLGGRLRCDGAASLLNDTLVLQGANLLPFGPGLYFQGSSSFGGIVFGNGILCLNGSTPRIEIRFADNTGASATTIPISTIFGGVATTGLGTYFYQLWYRDGPAFCTGAGYNLTNALSIVWEP